MFRKRRASPLPDAVRRGFGITAGLVDGAQRALIAAIPTSRDPGIPLEAALDAFLGRLDGLEASMPAWRDEGVMHEWTKCSNAIREAREQAEALRAVETELTFEQLNARVGDVLYPLEAFADTERDLRRR
ncbi:MAG: hypothetical protein ACXVD7_10445 [Actinomycetota bacterium]